MSARPQREVSEYDQAHRAHAAYYISMLSREAPKLHGGGSADGGHTQQRALYLLRIELGNVLRALDVALGQVTGPG
jgi:hypothetical protein